MTSFNKVGTYLTALLLIGVGGTLVFIHQFSDKSAAATNLVKTCSHAKDVSACYESEVPKLYPTVSIAQIFEVIREIRKEDSSYQFCHVLGHKLGERVVAQDPSKWVDAIPLNPPDGMCSNGFIHGVIGGRFRAEVLDDKTIAQLLPDFSRACAPRDTWSPSGLDRAICYHGMGHLYDYITNADLYKALGLCKKTVPDEYQRTCIEGVFMQIYQPLEPDDYALIKQMPVSPSTTTVRQFCARYPEPAYNGACLRESWPFFQDGIFDGTGISKFCSGQANTEQTEFCYQSAFTIVGRMSLEDPARAAKACELAVPARQAACYGIVAQAVLEEDRMAGSRAVALCEKALPAVASSCISTLIQHAKFIFGQSDVEFSNFCSHLPSSYTQSCLAANRLRS